jgi:DNA replication protein DnaC
MRSNLDPFIFGLKVRRTSCPRSLLVEPSAYLPIKPLVTCDLLILDEFGYLTLDPKVGPVLYEIIAGRYEKGATVITSNKSLSTWGELVGDSALMMAIIDRLLHHGEVIASNILSTFLH